MTSLPLELNIVDRLGSVIGPGCSSSLGIQFQLSLMRVGELQSSSGIHRRLVGALRAHAERIGAAILTPCSVRATKDPALSSKPTAIAEEKHEPACAQVIRDR